MTELLHFNGFDIFRYQEIKGMEMKLPHCILIDLNYIGHKKNPLLPVLDKEVESLISLHVLWRQIVFKSLNMLLILGTYKFDLQLDLICCYL